ncbi:MAG: hypothetical protein JW900_10095 [Anaerolineae bacterium]|nr:hypothetical protein [Anaerolineae bacterium]
MDEQELTAEPRRMQGRPFGIDPEGNKIRHVTGQLIRGAIEYMLEFVAEQTAATVTGATEAERAQQVQAAQERAFDKLVDMLNAAIDDPRYHVSREYLLNEGNYYSYEFEFFLCDLARTISGDPDFFFHRAKKSIPPSLAWIGRPFSLQQIYSLLPRFTAKLVDSDIRVKHVTNNSALIEWRAGSQIAKVPEPSRAGYIELGCRGYQGAYITIPPLVHAGLPPAQVRELTCQLEGDECCTWEFTWQNPQPSRRRWLGLGIAGTAALLVYSLSSLPGARFVAWLVLAPLLLSWLLPYIQRLEYEIEQNSQLILEQQETAEAQYDQIQSAYGDLQATNIDLQDKISELTTLHERIRQAAGKLHQATAEILAATTQQASGASEQSAAISQTTVTTAEVRATSEQAVKQAQVMTRAAQQGVQIAQSGQETVQETIASMGEIQRQIEAITQNVTGLSGQMRRIGRTIATVSEVASRSDVLAVNAAVEAARAGEQGLGFGVVAAEMRSLAEQSWQATEHVRSILLEIQHGILTVQVTTQEAAEAMAHGARSAQRTGEAIEDLARTIGDSTQAAKQVMTSGQQQAEGIEQIAVAMENIEQATDQSLASTRRAEDIAQGLADLAQQLTEIVGQ